MFLPLRTFTVSARSVSTTLIPTSVRIFFMSASPFLKILIDHLMKVNLDFVFHQVGQGDKQLNISHSFEFDNA